MKKSVTLKRTGLHYDTHQKALLDIRKRIEECKLSLISDKDEIYNLFMDLLERHPHIKLPKPNYFRIDKYKPGLHKVFMVHGELEKTFSINKCISNQSNYNHDLIEHYLRSSVVKQTNKFRGSPCAKCGSIESIEIDHIIPFKKIKNQFIQIYGSPDTQKISKIHTSNKTRIPHFLYDDDEYTHNWQNYHMEHSELQPLCKPCHNIKTYKR